MKDRAVQSTATASSRHLLSFIESSIDIGSWTFARNTKAMAWSEHLYRMLRIDRSSKASLDALLLRVHAEDRWILEELIRPHAVSTSLDARILFPNGRPRWFRFRSEAVSGSDLVIGYAQDVTVTRDREFILQQRSKLVERVIKMFGGIIWRANPSGNAYYDNGWCELTGSDPSDNVGDLWLNCLHPEDREETQTVWQRAVHARTPYRASYRVKVPDGSYRTIEARAHPSLDGEGELIEWVGVLVPRGGPLDLGVPPPSMRTGHPTGAETRAVRALLGLSVQDFAAWVGVSAATISRHESAQEKAPQLRGSTRARIAARLRDHGIHFSEVEGRSAILYDPDPPPHRPPAETPALAPGDADS